MLVFLTEVKLVSLALPKYETSFWFGFLNFEDMFWNAVGLGYVIVLIKSGLTN